MNWIRPDQADWRFNEYGFALGQNDKGLVLHGSK
jgi:hypothetical protein